MKFLLEGKIGSKLANSDESLVGNVPHMYEFIKIRIELEIALNKRRKNSLVFFNLRLTTICIN